MLDQAVALLDRLEPARFRSRDRAATERYAANLFHPHDLTPLDGRSELDADIRAFHGQSLTIVRIQHGADVLVDIGRLNNCYHVNVALAGALEARIDSDLVRTVPGQAMLFDAHRPVTMNWGADTVQLAIRIDRPALDRKLEQALGHPLTVPLRLHPLMEVRAGVGAQWVQTLVAALGGYLHTAETLHHRLALDLENLLIGQLLYTHPHNHLDELLGGPVLRVPRLVERAQEHIRANLAEALFVGDIAAAAGVSVRTLQTTFRDAVGVPPMEYVRHERLSRVHEELAAGLGPVSDVASRWGFGHLPRFAACYRARYGCAPSTTLLRGRAG